jgi:hypothetical protein
LYRYTLVDLDLSDNAKLGPAGAAVMCILLPPASAPEVGQVWTSFNQLKKGPTTPASQKPFFLPIFIKPKPIF